VTVSSVLGQLGAAQLSAYTATKAALNAYHSSLVAELAEYPNIKTILVSTGQLSTDMFNGLEQGPIQHFFGPIVEVSDLAMKIIKFISQGHGGVIAEPAYARWISIMYILPVGLQTFLRRLAGVDTAMKTFRPKN
jgi:short-subunit dehydrogenase